MSDFQKRLIDVSDPTRSAEHTDEALEALVTYNEHLGHVPEVYLQGNVLTRLGFADEQDGGRASMVFFTTPSLKETLSRACVFTNGVERVAATDDATGEVVERMKAAKPVAPPSYVIQALLDRTPDKLKGVPRITRVTEVPVYGADGSLQSEPGYAVGSRTFYQPSPELSVSEFDVGGWDRYDLHGAIADDLQDAVKTLGFPFRQFPFKDGASKANLIALILTPLVRDMIDGPTPMFVVSASTPGTGKGLLVDEALHISCGRDVKSVSYVSDENEFRKQITASLLGAPSALKFDNVNQPVNSGALAKLLTDREWADRIITTSKQARVQVRATFAMTANNPIFTDEIQRRSVPIMLERKSRAPEQYEIGSLPDYISRNRSDLVYAALTLVEAYQADAVSYQTNPLPVPNWLMPSYERWHEVLSGILRTAGIGNFMGNFHDFRKEANPDAVEREAFYADWLDRHPGPLTLTELVDVVNGVGITRAGGLPVGEMELPQEVQGARNEADLKKELGLFLRRYRNEICGDFRVVKHEGRHSQWEVVKL